MKYLKRFENIFDEIEVGDYVIIDTTRMHFYIGPKELENFINNSIGMVIGISEEYHNVTVRYDNIPESINLHFLRHYNDKKDAKVFDVDYIKCYADNIETLIIKSNADTYNL